MRLSILKVVDHDPLHERAEHFVGCSPVVGVIQIGCQGCGIGKRECDRHIEAVVDERSVADHRLTSVNGLHAGNPAEGPRGLNDPLPLGGVA